LPNHRTRLLPDRRVLWAAFDLNWEKLIMIHIASHARTLTFAVGLLVGASASAAPVLWVGDSAGNLGTVDVATHQVKVIGNMGHVMTDIAFDPKGNLFAINTDSLYAVDRNTASATLIGHTGGSFNSLVFDAAGTLYTASTALFSVNTATGRTTRIGNGSSAYFSSGDLAFIDGNLYLSVLGTSSSKDSLFRLNTATGYGTRVGSIGYTSVFGLATDNNIDLYGMSGTRVLDIDVETGAGSTLFDYQGHGLLAAYGTAFLTEATHPVPEPETYAMILSGLAMIAFTVKRRTRSQA
jgi:hypothetical protein